MEPLEATARLHELGDAAEGRAAKLEDHRMDRRGVAAVRDDALFMHVLAEALEEAAEKWPTAIGAVAARAGELYEERRK